MRICSNGCRAPASDTFSAPSWPGSAVPGGNPRAVTSSVRARIHRLARDVRGAGSRRGPVRPGRRAGRPVRGGDRAVRPPRDGVPAAGGVEHGAVAPAADARGHAGRVGRTSRRPSPTCSRPVARSRTPRPRPTSATSADYVDGADGAGWDFTAERQRQQRHRRLHARRSPATRASTSATRTARSACRAATASASPAGSPGRSRSPTTPPPGQAVADPALDDHRDHRRPALGHELNAGLGILGVAVIGDAGTARRTTTSRAPSPRAGPTPTTTPPAPSPSTTPPPPRPTTASWPPTVPAPASSPRPGSGTLAGNLVAEPRANDRVAGLPSVGTTVDPDAPPSPAHLRGAVGDRGRPRRGQAVPHADPARPRRRSLAGRVGGPRHAGRQGRRTSR